MALAWLRPAGLRLEGKDETITNDNYTVVNDYRSPPQILKATAQVFILAERFEIKLLSEWRTSR
jgi:hypothetical protein